MSLRTNAEHLKSGRGRPRGGGGGGGCDRLSGLEGVLTSYGLQESDEIMGGQLHASTRQQAPCRQMDTLACLITGKRQASVNCHLGLNHNTAVCSMSKSAFPIDMCFAPAYYSQQKLPSGLWTGSKACQSPCQAFVSEAAEASSTA